MATKGHHRKRSSVDRVIDLLADLEESQIALLLDDLNHTTSSNVPVPEAIRLFEQHAGKSGRKSCRSPSPMRTLEVELERRHSKRVSSRISAVPEHRIRSKTHASHHPPPVSQEPAPSSPPASSSPSPLSPPTPPAAFPVIARPPSPPDHSSPMLPQSVSAAEGPKTSSSGPPRASRPRSYKRISRPMILSPTATAELHQLLLAFFNETPVAPASPAITPTPSPTTPLFGFSHSPFTEIESEPSTPGLDLLEPSPIRTPSFSGGRSLKPMPSIGSIFEAFKSQ
ncbi:hypothetical protein VTH82DRAFT_5292 [Thermothelomyces myriococcoides]